MLRDSVPPWSFHSPVCTITAVSKDLVRRPLVFQDLSLATWGIARKLGVLFSRLRPIRRGKLSDPVAGDGPRYVLVLRSMRKPQRFLADVFVNHSSNRER